jgi:pimeloyl-ACP methyl ester carboxylesterase
VVAPPARRDGRVTAAFEPFALETHDGQTIVGELGRLLVPERHAQGDGPLIELAFLRLPTTSDGPGPPVVFLAGGPGLSPIEWLRWPQARGWADALRAAGDLILLDQRGVGLSRPRLDCPQSVALPLDRPVTREELLAAYADRSREAADFWRDRGVDLGAYNTEENADDVDALRGALGVETISLVGESYGSHLGLATIRRHRGRIHRAVLSLVEGPDHTDKLPSTSQRLLERLDLVGPFEEALARLEGQAVGAFDLRLVTAQSIGDIEFLRLLPARLAGEEPGWLAREALRLRRRWLGSAMSWAMDCASGVSPERRARIEREAGQTLLGDLVNFPVAELREVWDVPDLGSAFRAAVHSDVETLFISGSLDARTPVENAEEIRAGFPRSEHIVVEGAAHDLDDAPPELLARVTRFLRGT